LMVRAQVVDGAMADGEASGVDTDEEVVSLAQRRSKRELRGRRGMQDMDELEAKTKALKDSVAPESHPLDDVPASLAALAVLKKLVSACALGCLVASVCL
jgi:hypothetical protein